MKKLLKFLQYMLKWFVGIFWICLFTLGVNLVNQNVVWQNCLGILILCLTLFGLGYYIKDSVRMFLKNMRGVFFNKEKEK